MNLEQKLEAARTRAEKQSFTSHQKDFNSLTPNEGFYDSVAEQIERRNEYIEICEEEIKRLQNLVNELDAEDPLEKHLKSTAWNLNRIANVLEEQFSLSDSQAILAQLRSKGGRKNG